MHFAEIAHEEGPETRTVQLTVSEKGVRLYAQDIGSTAQQIFQNGGEYEFWVDVEPSDMHALLFALLEEKYAGNPKAVDQFREFCERSKVPHDFWTWT
jgi:hypothetical protein